MYLKLSIPWLCLSIAACSSTPVVPGPLQVSPPLQPAYLERPSNGSIYQPHMNAASLFSADRKPRQIGDKLKVDIAETLKASQKLATNTSRDNKLANKGPGDGSNNHGLFRALANINATAAGSDSYDGSGKTEQSSSFNAQLAVAVVNVLPNGHLVVAGERSMAFNGGQNTLRFSGIVNPQDIRPGNIVASADVVNARLEVAGQGDVSEAASRNWLQRVLTHTMSVW